MNDPLINVAGRCKSRTEYDTVPLSENVRLQIGDDASKYLDIALRGDLAGKIQSGKSYQLTITEIVS